MNPAASFPYFVVISESVTVLTDPVCIEVLGVTTVHDAFVWGTVTGGGTVGIGIVLPERSVSGILIPAFVISSRSTAFSAWSCLIRVSYWAIRRLSSERVACESTRVAWADTPNGRRITREKARRRENRIMRKIGNNKINCTYDSSEINLLIGA